MRPRPNLFASLSFTALLVLSSAQPSRASQVTLQVSAADPMMASGEEQTGYIRIALTGTEIEKSQDRPPVNVAIVIDNSSSMQRSKIEQARSAAIAAIQRLRDDDIVSVALYNSNVTVLVPATKATDRVTIAEKIRSIQANGSTALFAGVSKGAAEVQKFLSSQSVNRVILLSDGQANIGPASPSELERLGASLVKEGIRVSTPGEGSGHSSGHRRSER